MHRRRKWQPISFLENPRDSGVWWAAVYGIAQSQTPLKQLSSSSSMSKLWELVILSNHLILSHLLRLLSSMVPSMKVFSNVSALRIRWPKYSLLLLLLQVASVLSNSVQPHRGQPTRLPRPWDSPGKNTGAGCLGASVKHFFKEKS